MNAQTHKFLMIGFLVLTLLAAGMGSPLQAEQVSQFFQEPVAGMDGIPPQPPADSIGLNILLNQVDEGHLRTHIAMLQSFGTRHVNSSYTDPNRGIGAAYRYILSQFQAISRERDGNFAVWTDYFRLEAYGRPSSARNIVGVIADTEYDSGTIIIGAHYDSRCSKVGDYLSDAPGADDNASGVAALIELARILSANPHRYRIMLVAFSAEEVWTTNVHGELRGSGSMAFAQDFVQANHINVKAMINLDMIGSSGPDGQNHDHEIRLFSAGPDNSVSLQLAWEIYHFGEVYVPEMHILVDEQETGDRDGRYGDQLSFSDAGYPAVRFIEPMEDHNHQHNDGDTIDRIEVGYLTEVTRCLLALIAVMADQA